jgi:site-specific recombinase XerD
MRLDEAIQLFLGTYHKKSTAEAYWKTLKFLKDQIGAGRRLDEITPGDVIRVHNYFLEQNYAAATLRQRTSSIKIFFNWLKKMELITENPARVIKIKNPRRPHTREKAITDEEIRMLLNYVQYRSKRDFALFLFLADTGCRIGGAAGLRERDINWQKREAVVTEKGDLMRNVRFGRDTANVLRQFLIMRKATKGDYVFSKDGSRVNAETLSQRIRRACYGLRKQGHSIRILSAHTFRHRKGHQFADAKLNPAVAATALGHESVMTTIEHYYPDDWETAALALDDLAMKLPEQRLDRLTDG